MRHTCASSNGVKHLAKTLKATLAERGTSASLPSCQDAIASAHGFDHWHEMSFNVGRPQDGGPFEGRAAVDALARVVGERHRLDPDEARSVAAATLRDKVDDLRVEEFFIQLTAALTPREWLRENGVSVDGSGRLDEGACAAAFARQLGEAWTGLRGAPPLARCLATMFGLHAATSPRDKVVVSHADHVQSAQHLRQQVAWIQARHPGVGLSPAVDGLVAPMLANDDLVASIDKVASGHAWTATALVALLAHARKRSGVLASAEFQWLKSLDRTLYYVLNNAGRSAHHVEGSGAIAHFEAERVEGRRLVETRVDEAVWSVQDHLDAHGHDPENLDVDHVESVGTVRSGRPDAASPPSS